MPTAPPRPPEPTLTGLYFAYGQHLDPQLLRAHGGRPAAVGVARLAGHRLAFFGRSATWDGGMETAEAEAGEVLWGVLYAMEDSDWERLDAWMGARLDGGGTYFHYPAMVLDTAGRGHHVRLYKKDLQGPPRLPSTEALARIVAAARRQGLPAAYVDALARRPSRPAAWPVPAAGNPARGLAVLSDCRTCAEGER